MKSLLLSVSALSLFSTACIDESVTEPTLDDETIVDDGEVAPSEVMERIALNALTPDELATVSLSSGMLTSTSLNNMASTANGRAALEYVVGCALGAGQSVTANVGGSQYTFVGAIGIATTWTTIALTVTQQRWISSCVISRINMLGEKVTISVRGSLTPAFGTTSTELTSYQVQEGAFFGNLFGSGRYIASCNGVDQAANDTYGDLPKRECAEDGNCTGFHYAGLCSDVCSSSNGIYTACQAPNGVTYGEVATTYLYGLPQ